MTALFVTGCTCAMTFGGGRLALRLEAYRAFILAFAAGALVTTALIDVIPDALEMLTRSGDLTTCGWPSPPREAAILFAPSSFNQRSVIASQWTLAVYRRQNGPTTADAFVHQNWIRC
jgi:hypothetical protein